MSRVARGFQPSVVFAALLAVAQLPTELLPVEEITERIILSRGNLNPGDDDPNQPPTITVAPVTAAAIDSPVTLIALVTDDGLPKPRSAPALTSPSTDATAIRAQANSS